MGIFLYLIKLWNLVYDGHVLVAEVMFGFYPDMGLNELIKKRYIKYPFEAPAPWETPYKNAWCSLRAFFSSTCTDGLKWTQLWVRMDVSACTQLWTEVNSLRSSSSSTGTKITECFLNLEAEAKSRDFVFRLVCIIIWCSETDDHGELTSRASERLRNRQRAITNHYGDI